ncbi:MAG: ATP-binding protein [Tenuifilaceae bacterium]|nr:ATP-binding protein [Tenuifilaceae bacterium]
MRSKWFVISAIFGILSFVLSTLSIEFKIETTTITLTWSVIFPIIVSLAYGMRGAIVSAIFGAMWIPIILWPENGWGLIPNIIAYGLFYLLIGFNSENSNNNGSRLRKTVFSTIIFVLLYLFLYLFVFRWILNYTGEHISYKTVLTILTKNVIIFIIVLIFGESLLRTNNLRKLLQLETNIYRKNNCKLIIYSLLTSVFIWGAFTLLYQLFNPIGTEKEYTGLLFIVLFFSSGIISRWLIFASETQIKAELGLIEFKDHLEDLVKIRTRELEETIKKLTATKASLIQADKMASLGTLTSGIAHEINNPLNFIMGAYDGLANYFKKHGSLEADKTELLVSSMNIGIERISNIVHGLDQFSRYNENMDEDCEIHSILENCFVILNNKTKHRISIEKNYAQETIHIKGNVGKLHQTFFNVLTNSIQSINAKGRIVVATKVEGINVIIEITDTGGGIEKKYLEQLTNPFFTTKPPGEGTGLGLSITYSIITEHKGTIEFKSELGVGTTVTIRLPYN